MGYLRIHAYVHIRFAFGVHLFVRFEFERGREGGRAGGGGGGREGANEGRREGGRGVGDVFLARFWVF